MDVLMGRKGERPPMLRHKSYDRTVTRAACARVRIRKLVASDESLE